MSRRSWVQDPKTGKLIPKEEYQRESETSAYIQGPIDPFVSPIDGRVIRDRKHLRDHNREHGVTNSADYSAAFMLTRSHDRVEKMMGQTSSAKAERRELIMREMAKHA